MAGAKLSVDCGDISNAYSSSDASNKFFRRAIVGMVALVALLSYGERRLPLLVSVRSSSQAPRGRLSWRISLYLHVD